MSLCTFQGGSSSSSFLYFSRGIHLKAHTNAYALSHTHINSYIFRRTSTHTHTPKRTRNSTITSQHPPLYSNQGWKYHQTGPDPRTCVEIFPGQTLEKVSRDSSSPSSSYASGPRGPPWTEARTRKGRNRDSKRGRRRENRKVMVDIWGQVSLVFSSGISGKSALSHQHCFRGPHTGVYLYSLNLDCEIVQTFNTKFLQFYCSNKCRI